MKIAAVQMAAKLGAVEANMEAAARLAKEAFASGAQMVILPEFFTSAMGFDPRVLKAVRPADGAPLSLLRSLASDNGGIVGGSFIAWENNNAVNRFVLAFPDGSCFCHDKDQPTMWENCYYKSGHDDGVMETPAGAIGAALCWEFVRTRTVRRLKGRVRLIVGGSCWWSLPQKFVPGFGPKLREQMHWIMEQTPARFAAMAGAPVVHAAHAGDFSCRMPLLPGFPYDSYFEGETQITDGAGNVLCRMRREDGEGFVCADVDLSRTWEPSETVPDRFWIPDLPCRILSVWAYQNLHGKCYYRLRARQAMRKLFS